MDERNPTTLFRRKDSRWTTLTIGVGFTVALFFALKLEADRRAASLLEQSHRSARRLLMRDVEELRRQLQTRVASTDPSQPIYERLQFRSDANGVLSLRDEQNSELALPPNTSLTALLGNALTEPSSAYHEVRGYAEQSLAHSEPAALEGSLLEAETEIKGTNLSVYSALSLTAEEARHYGIVAATALFWILLSLAQQVKISRRRRWEAEAHAWLDDALAAAAVGKEAPELTNSLASTVEGQLLLRFRYGLTDALAARAPAAAPAPAEAPPLPSRIVDPSARLAQWDFFRANLKPLSRNLQAGETFLLAKIALKNPAQLNALARALAPDLALSGEYLQASPREGTLVYALRAPDQDSLLYGTFAPFRGLVEAKLLEAGTFEATLLVQNRESPARSLDQALAELQVDKPSYFTGRDPRIPTELRTHLTLREWLKSTKVTTFNLTQLLYVDTAVSQGEIDKEEPASESAKERRRNRRPRNSLGRKPTLPRPPENEKWH